MHECWANRVWLYNKAGAHLFHFLQHCPCVTGGGRLKYFSLAARILDALLVWPMRFSHVRFGKWKWDGDHLPGPVLWYCPMEGIRDLQGWGLSCSGTGRTSEDTQEGAPGIGSSFGHSSRCPQDLREPSSLIHSCCLSVAGMHSKGKSGDLDHRDPVLEELLFSWREMKNKVIIRDR